MIPIYRLMQAPHMETLLDHPALEAMPDRELRALESFMGFCAAHRVADPVGADIQAFAQLRDQAPTALLDLREALRRLGLGKDLLDQIDTVHAIVEHRANFAGVTKGDNRNHVRTVSVKPDELPIAWQETLCRLRIEEKYSVEILKRMQNRLCMFAWSARKVGRPIDLADTPALRAFYENMRARSINRQREQAAKKGLNDDIDTPRWAYLRSAWEEMRRFAQHHGLSDEVRDKLNVTYSHLVEKESCQTAQKIAKAKAAGTRPELLKKAEAMLVDAQTLPHPHMRHALRNRAAAIALGCAVPARPADVQAHHILGIGIIFEAARNGYRFRYTAKKTAGSTGAKIDVPLLPWWNKFIDALILQGSDPRYLGQLRTKVLSEKRPLYVGSFTAQCRKLR